MAALLAALSLLTLLALMARRVRVKLLLGQLSLP